MAENSDGQDKIFDATPKRIEDAKKEGKSLPLKRYLSYPLCFQ